MSTKTDTREEQIMRLLLRKGSASIEELLALDRHLCAVDPARSYAA